MFVSFLKRYFNGISFKSRCRYRVILLFRKELKFRNNFENTATIKIAPLFGDRKQNCKRQQRMVGQIGFMFSEFQVYRFDQSKSLVARFVYSKT